MAFGGALTNLIYRARMALGDLAEKSGRLDEAAAHYQEATLVLPTWQKAYFALAHALHGSGSHGRAREVLHVGLTLDPSAEAEVVWWSYEMGLVPRLPRLLERMA